MSHFCKRAGSRSVAIFSSSAGALKKKKKKEEEKRKKEKKERKERERKEKKRFRIEISNYLVNTERRNTNLKPYAPLFKTWCGFRFDES